MNKLTIIGRITSDDLKIKTNQYGRYGFITVADNKGKDKVATFFNIMIKENVIKYLETIKNNGNTIKGATVYTENDITISDDKDINGNFITKVFIVNKETQVLFTANTVK